jgi:hypothetical protein
LRTNLKKQNKTQTQTNSKNKKPTKTQKRLGHAMCKSLDSIPTGGWGEVKKGYLRKQGCRVCWIITNPRMWKAEAGGSQVGRKI